KIPRYARAGSAFWAPGYLSCWNLLGSTALAFDRQTRPHLTWWIVTRLSFPLSTIQPESADLDPASSHMPPTPVPRGDQPIIFKSPKDVKETKRLPIDKMEAFDCRTLSMLDDGQWWISSPNMDYIPELPTHKLDEEFGYYSDGMLGPFEHLKWPQAYDGGEPHALAAPMNPSLTSLLQVADQVKLQPEYMLPEYTDFGAPWFDLEESDWLPDPALEDCGWLDPS
ncbi:hypothetical protein BV25DRAFT_1918440, partial [Artomyces pyxidatus]